MVNDRAKLRAKWRRQWHNRQDNRKGVTRRRRPGRPRKLTPDQELAFQADWHRGVTVRAMAVTWEMSPSTVERTARILGLPRRQVRFPAKLARRPAHAVDWWQGAE